MMSNKIILHTQGRAAIVRCMDIVWCRGDGAYTGVHTTDGEALTLSKSLGSLMAELALPYFLRVSQSALVNAHHIRYIHYKQRILELITGDSIHYTLSAKKLEAYIIQALQDRNV